MRRRNVTPVADETIASCESSHDAANENRSKANVEVFDDTGLMALTCRHDNVIFYANIDTPGEQQKYAVALLERFFKHIPAHATVCALYDIGCVLSKSLEKVSSGRRYFSDVKTVYTVRNSTGIHHR
jgi:hypothetical protein